MGLLEDNFHMNWWEGTGCISYPKLDIEPPSKRPSTFNQNASNRNLGRVFF